MLEPVFGTQDNAAKGWVKEASCDLDVYNMDTGKRVSIHKQLFATLSEPIRAFVSKNPKASTMIARCNIEGFDQIVSFFYGEPLDVSFDNLEILLPVVESFQIIYLQKMLSPIAKMKDKTKIILEQSKDGISPIAANFLARIFPLVKGENWLGSQPPDVISAVITSKFLVLEREMALIDFLIAYCGKWEGNAEALNLFSEVKSEYLTENECRQVLEKYPEHIVQLLMLNRLSFVDTPEAHEIAKKRFQKFDVPKTWGAVRSFVQAE